MVGAMAVAMAKGRRRRRSKHGAGLAICSLSRAGDGLSDESRETSTMTATVTLTRVRLVSASVTVPSQFHPAQHRDPVEGPRRRLVWIGLHRSNYPHPRLSQSLLRLPVPPSHRPYQPVKTKRFALAITFVSDRFTHESKVPLHTIYVSQRITHELRECFDLAGLSEPSVDNAFELAAPATSGNEGFVIRATSSCGMQQLGRKALGPIGLED